MRLARTVTGDFADFLNEYLDYLEYLTTMRCNFNDDCFLSFDDEFRTGAKHEKFSLFD